MQHKVPSNRGTKLKAQAVHVIPIQLFQLGYLDEQNHVYVFMFIYYIIYVYIYMYSEFIKLALE